MGPEISISRAGSDDRSVLYVCIYVALCVFEEHHHPPPSSCFGRLCVCLSAHFVVRFVFNSVLQRKLAAASPQQCCGTFCLLLIIVMKILPNILLLFFPLCAAVLLPVEADVTLTRRQSG